MQTEETKVTFTPLSRGRFRLRLNGKLTKVVTKNCDRVRRIFLNRGKSSAPREEVKTTIMSWDGEWVCPHCGRSHYDSSSAVGKVRNCGCNKKVMITGQRARPQQQQRMPSFERPWWL